MTQKILLLIGVLFLSLFIPRPFFAWTIDPRIGITHIAGLYPNYGANFMKFGALDLLNLGFKTIEIGLTQFTCTVQNKWPEGAYNTRGECPNWQSITEGLQSALYSQTLSLPFHTIIIDIDTLTPGAAHQWSVVQPELYSQSQKDLLYQDFYDATVYLIQNFANSNKTFILQNPNEIDWQMLFKYKSATCPPCDDVVLDSTVIQNARDYWNTVQNAIDAAKMSHSSQGVSIYHGCELNRVLRGIDGKTSAVNDVLPYSHCDLYGYSAYESYIELFGTTFITADRFVEAVNYIKSQAPDNSVFGNDNVYISEFGYPQVNYGEEAAAAGLMTFLPQALDTLHTPYFMFWQLYDNECDIRFPAIDTQCRGFFIRKPNGDLSKVYKNGFSQSKYIDTKPTIFNWAGFVSQNIPTTMIPGKTYQVKMKFRNDGLNVWTKETKFRLGIVNDADASRWSISRTELAPDELISWGQDKEFTFIVTAPPTPGTYSFQWQILQEGVEWFGEKSPDTSIAVRSSPFTMADLKSALTNYLSSSDQQYMPVDNKINTLDTTYVIKWLQ